MVHASRKSVRQRKATSEDGETTPDDIHAENDDRDSDDVRSLPSMRSASMFSLHTVAFESERAPAHVHKNKFMRKGFHRFSSHRQALRLLYTWSNESSNIWTSLLSLCYNVWLHTRVHSLFSPSQRATLAYRGLETGISALHVNFILTACYHIFCSTPYYHHWTIIDLFGINVALGGFLVAVASNWPLTLSWLLGDDFALDPTTGFRMAFGLLSLTAGYVLVWRTLHWRECPKGLLFTNISVTTLLTLPHYVMEYGRFHTQPIQAIVILALALAIFVLKIPEVFLTRTFDYHVHSHAIWHVGYATFFWLIYNDLTTHLLSTLS